jgi:hypothetical protein
MTSTTTKFIDKILPTRDLKFPTSGNLNFLPSKKNDDKFRAEIKMPEVSASGTTSDSEEPEEKQTDMLILTESPNLYKQIGDSMSKRFIKFIPSEKCDWLQSNHPNAFLLLCLIARRATISFDHEGGLEIGTCYIADYKSSGIQTEKQYRIAKKVLENEGMIKICKTSKINKKISENFQKNDLGKKQSGATKKQQRRATNGTFVSILKSDIWDINYLLEGEQKKLVKGDPNYFCNEYKKEFALKKEREEKEKGAMLPKRKSPEESPLFEKKVKKKERNAEQEDVFQGVKAFCQLKQIKIGEQSLERWIFKFSHVKVRETFDLMLKRQVDIPERWMESALKSGWAQEQKNMEECKRIFMRIKSQNSWRDLEIKEKYCVDLKTREQYSFLINPKTFEDCLTNALRKKSEYAV